jgi:hypothetical protein
MVPDPVARLHYDQIEPKRQMRQRRTVRQGATLEESEGRRPDPRPLAVIDGLLGQAEVSASAPANLDGNERGRRPRIDGHDVQLVAADADVPGQDRPTGRGQSVGDELFGSIPRSLGIGPHGCTVARAA